MSLSDQICSDPHDQAMLDHLLETTNEDLVYSLRDAIVVIPENTEFLRKILSKLNDAGDCLNTAIVYVKDTDFILEVMEKTADFTDALATVIWNKPDELKILTSLLGINTRDYEHCLRYIVMKGLYTNPFYKRVFDNIYPLATPSKGIFDITYKTYPEDMELLRKIIKKDIDHEKYSHLLKYEPINNTDCYICISQICDNDEIYRLECGHRIHKQCNMGKFNCRFH